VAGFGNSSVENLDSPVDHHVTTLVTLISMSSG
jgi:hypothetical protein